MITNYTKNIYKVLEQFKFQENKPIKKSKGLLTPVKNFMKDNNESMANQPAYRVAKYMNTIRKKRMEFNNVGRETT
tara:strand:+ start:290 stop:517 length:228 start_codon:yes stop_codon:yes gene_type:complete